MHFFPTDFGECSCKSKWSVMPKPTYFATIFFCYGVSYLPLLSFSSQLCNFSCHPLRLEEASVFHLLNKSPLFLFHFPFPLLKTHLGAKTSCSWLSFMPALDRREGVKKEKDDLQTYSPNLQLCSCVFRTPISDGKNETQPTLNSPRETA